MTPAPRTWEAASRQPDARLRGSVQSYSGYVERFRADVGLAPKAVARILRFARVTRTLRANAGTGLAGIAYACGFADQAHLNRDFREFAGTTPTDFAARLLPGGGGVSAAELPNVHDVLARAA